MNNAIDVINLAVSIIIRAGIIAILAFLAVLAYRGLSPESNGMQYYLNRDFWNDYDGLVLDGETVRYLFDNSEDYLVKIYSKKHPEGYTPTEGITNIREADSDYFIDPSEKFVCSVLKDVNGELIGYRINQFGVSAVNLTEMSLRKKISIYSKGIQCADNQLSDYKRKIDSFNLYDGVVDQSVLSTDMLVESGVSSAAARLEYLIAEYELYKSWYNLIK